MNDQQLSLFMEVEEVLRRHGASFKDLCETYALAFERDAAEEPHITANSCLRQAAEHLRNAGMDWYVSTK